MDYQVLVDTFQQRFAGQFESITTLDIVTVEVKPENLIGLCIALRDEEDFLFEQLMDVCGVDYDTYGTTTWRVKDTTTSGFSRGVNLDEKITVIPWNKPRYGVTYHLLSITHNHRLRIKVYLQPEPLVPSVIDIWNSANWYEREAFDLFGIVFEGHPDLRRILTDYGFHGHPFRKDFPLIGEVELRYDAASERCVYEPVSINQRVNVPKVIREDNRYRHTQHEEGNPDA